MTGILAPLGKLAGAARASLSIVRRHGAWAGARALLRHASNKLIVLHRELAWRPSEGSGVECPVCGWQGPCFLWHIEGAFAKPNEMCPICASGGRHRTAIRLFTEALELFRQAGPMIHFSPHPALRRLWQRFGAQSPYVAVDRVPGEVNVVADAMALPFRSRSIQTLVTSHVLEHIRDDRKALLEIARVLQPEGVAVIIVPLDPTLATTEEWPAPEPNFGHWRLYGADIESRLAEVFEVTRLEPAELFHTTQVRRHALDLTPVFVCRRQA